MIERLKQQQQIEFLSTDSYTEDNGEYSETAQHSDESIQSKHLANEMRITVPPLVGVKSKRSLSLNVQHDNWDVRASVKDSFFEDEATSD